jgi:hypothetical protein
MVGQEWTKCTIAPIHNQIIIIMGINIPILHMSFKIKQKIPKKQRNSFCLRI